MQLSNKVVWVVGATSGIGQAFAMLAARQGARLVLSGRNEQALQSLASQLPGSLPLALDMEAPQHFEQACQQVQTHFGGLDLLLLSAGISQRAGFLQLPDEAFRRIFEVNFFGAVGLTRVALPLLLQSGGMLVGISSVQGKFGQPERTAYAASKHAFQGFFDSLRAEYAAQGLKVLLVAPGYVQTALGQHALGPDGKPGGQAEKKAYSISAEACAQQILRGVERESLEIYPGNIRQTAGVYLQRLWPGLMARLIRKK